MHFSVLQLAQIPALLVHGPLVFVAGLLLARVHEEAVQVVVLHQVVGLHLVEDVLAALLLGHGSAVVLALLVCHVLVDQVHHGLGLIIVLRLQVLELVVEAHRIRERRAGFGIGREELVEDGAFAVGVLGGVGLALLLLQGTRRVVVRLPHEVLGQLWVALPFMHSFRILVQQFVSLFVEADVFEVLFVMLQCRFPFLEHFLVGFLHLLPNEILVVNFGLQTVLTLLLVLLQTSDMELEEIHIFLHLVVSGHALGPLFLLLITLVDRLVKILLASF